MKLHFLGANRQVTGSRYCLESNGMRIMVDCGMFQERPYLHRNWDQCPISAQEVDALVLTHVHIDHSGLIPRLVQEGFRGPIYSTRPSVDLAEIVLRDAAKIQMEDVRFKRKRHEREGRRGKHPDIPLFTEEDVETALKLFRSTPYEKPLALSEDTTVTFHEAGHILGSAMLEFDLPAAHRSPGSDERRKLLFSGDIGQWDKPLIRDPTVFDRADYVVMETTYGDRDHSQFGDIGLALEKVIHETLDRGGNLVIPIFAVERAQEVIYHISRLAHADRIPELDIFLDSPMAVDVTEVFRNHRDCLDEETWRLIMSRETPLHFPGLHMVRDRRDSKAINELKRPCIIMSTSGMCTSGRIKHHLRANIGRGDSTILFVGYQAHGTLGRQILEGNSLVRIHGRQWKVKAHIEQIEGFSGHADRQTLLKWIGHLKEKPRRVYLTHGEEDASLEFADTLRNEWGWNVCVPEYQQTVELDGESAC